MTDTFTAEDLWRLARVGAPRPVADGRAVIVPVVTWDEAAPPRKLERLWRVPTDGGPPTPLTGPDDSASQPAPSPDGRLLAFVRKPRGATHGQLHVMPLDGGEAVRLTDLPLGVSDPRWFPDGRRIGFLAELERGAFTPEATQARLEARRKWAGPHVTEERVVRFWDRWLTHGAVHHVFVAEVPAPGAPPGRPRDLTPTSTHRFDLMDPTGQWDIAPDGAEVVFSGEVGAGGVAPLRWALFAAPVAGGPLRCLTPDAPADEVRPRYTPDGAAIVFGAKADPTNYADRIRLARYDRASGQRTVLTDGWDLSAAEWALLDERTVAVTAEDHGRRAIFRCRIDAGPAVPERVLWDGAGGEPFPGPDGHLYLHHHTLSRPPEVVRVTLAATGPARLERLTRFNDALLSERALGAAEPMELPGADGVPVQTWLVYPPGYDRSRDGPLPLVQLLHGGPNGMHGDQWHFRWNPQILAARGYLVALVNFHGSSGFGQAFGDSVLGDWGGKPARDVLDATEALVERGLVDPRRMALCGGSYGGYLTVWLTTQTDRFACAVAHAAVFSVAALYGSDVSQGLEREIGGEPWGTPEMVANIRRNDPAAFMGNIRTPTLVTHGEKDFRVPVSHGLELYGVLTARGVPARLVHYPDENHWIQDPRNSRHWFGEVLDWLERYMRARPTFGAG